MAVCTLTLTIGFQPSHAQQDAGMMSQVNVIAVVLERRKLTMGLRLTCDVTEC